MAGGVVVFGPAQRADAGPAPVMFGYVPLPADQFATPMSTISASQATVSGSTIDFTVGITNASGGAVMYYDQWEDGYETDIANPTQSSTLVFGDGNTANGNAATYCGARCTGDILPQGAALIFRNNITTPRGASPSSSIFDGRDKVASTRGFALTAGGFATNVGSLLASVVSAYDTTKYGTDFVVPVGQNTAVPSGTTNANAYTGLFIQASQPGTQVQVDTNGDGTVDVTQTIGEGAIVHVNGGVQQGATVKASKPVQVHVATGDTTANYESRWYTLFPNSLLSNDYMSPAGSGTNNFRTVNYLYNPNSSAITVTPTCGRTVTDGVTTNASTTLTSATAAFTAADVGSLVGGSGIPAGTRIASVTNATTVVMSAAATATATGVTVSIGCAGTISIPAKSGATFVSPLGQAVRFQAAGGAVFSAVAGVGAQSGSQPGGGTDQSSAWDWGFPMVPTSLLTTQVVLGFAPGNSTNPPSSAPAGNYDDGPVWVTSLSATTLRVDFDGDPSTGTIGTSDCFGARHDLEIPVAALASTRIFDSTDGSMTGARIYTCDGTKIAAAWGEDSANAPTGSPGFDAGYTVIPTTVMLVNKTAALATDTNGDGKFGPGDTITYTISIADAGALAFTSVKVNDNPPPGTQYVPGTTTFNDGVTTSPIADDVVPPASTVFPLDESGASLPNINPGQTVSVSFQTVVQDPISAAGTLLTNVACATASEANACDTEVTPLASSDLSLTKAVQTAPTFVGTNGVFRITVSNAGPDTATGVEVTDVLPAGTSFVSSSASQGSYDSGSGIWSVGTLNSGASATLDLTAQVNVTSATNFAQVTKAQSADPDSQPAENPLGPGNPPDQDDEASATITASLRPNMAVTKSDSGATVAPGGTVTYAIGYANNGAGNATGVTLTETVPANSTFNAGASSAGWSCANGAPAGTTCTLAIGAVAAGGSGTRNFAVTAVNPVPAGVSQLSNTVSVSSTEPDADPSDNTATDTTPVDAVPDLSVSKSDGGVSTTPGGTVAYTLSYANTGNQGATGVVLTETVPANSTFNAGASSAGWSCANGSAAGTTCTLTVGSLAAGASGSRTFAVTAVSPLPAGVTQLSNTVSVADDGTNGPDPTPGNNTGSDTTPVDAAPDLSVAKSDGGASTTPGGTVAYTIDYANTGNQAATGVVLTETVPANSTFDAGGSTAGWVCVPDGNAGSTCTLAVGSLAAGATGSATFAVTTASPLPAGVTQLSNTVSVADDGTNGPDPTPGNNTGSDTTPIDTATDLAVAKSDGDVSVSPGGVVAYTITYTNNGLAAATNVVLTETVPSGSSFVSASSTPGWSCVGATCTLNVGTVDPGAGGTATFAVRATFPVAGGLTQLDNTVTVGADQTDPTPGNNTGTDSTPIVTGTLGDTVFLDVNGNSAPDPGEGISGVTVKVIWPGPDGTYGNGDDVEVSATTGANGDWSITGLPAGSLHVVVDTATLPAGVANTVDPDGGNDSTSAVDLPAGATDLDQDFGYRGTASIGDRVWNDANGNGLQDPGELGVSGVTVDLLDGSGNVLATTTTDGTGAYQFADLVPGTYEVRFVAPAGTAFALPNAGGDDTVDSDAAVATGRTGTFVLAGGQTKADVDAGLVTLSSLQALVFLDPNNNGDVDPGDGGLSGQTVTLTGTDDLGNAVSIPATTDGAGTVTFTSLRPGSYTLTETQPSGLLDGKDTAGSAGGSTAVNDVISGITIAPATTAAGYRFAELAPSSLSGVVFSDASNDGVQDPGEPGIAGVTVTLTGTDDLGNPVNVVTTTDASGGYAFTGLRPGTYTVTETQPGGWLDGAEVVGTAGGSAAVNDVVSGVVLTPGTTATGYLFGELAPSSVSGRVFDDLNDNGAADGGEPGLPGVTVTLTGFDDQGPVNVVTTTDANGAFSFSNLRPGTYTVTESQPPTFLDGTDTAGSLGGTVANDVVSDIVVPPGSTGTGYLFAEVAPASIGDRVWSDLNGDGVQDAGEPGLAGVTVTLRQDADGNGSFETTVASTTTDANGLYLFEQLRPGSYQVDVDGTTVPAGATPSTPEPVDRVLVGGQSVTDADVGYQPAPPPIGQIGDRVWSDTDGDGVQDPGEVGLGGVLVTLLQDADNNGSYETTVATDITTGAGDYGFTDLPAGSYRVVVTPPSGQTATTPTTVDVALTKDQVRNDVDFGFQPPAPPPPATVGDRVWNDANGNGVQDPGEAGIPGVTVTLRQDADGNGSFETVAATQVTGADGKYLFANLPVGSYQVVVTVPSGQNPTTPTSVAAPLTGGEVIDTADFGLRAAAPAPGSIGDRVWDDTNGNGSQDPGEPGLSGVSVKLVRDLDGDGVFETTVATTTTDATGTYGFSDLPPGSYRVVVTPPSGFDPTTPPVIPVALSAGQVVTDADVGLTSTPVATGSIGDRVWSDTDRDGVQDPGEPGLNGVTVTLLRDGDGDGVYETTVATTTTAGDGNYLFGKVVPGSYRVVVTPPAGQSPTTPASIVVSLAADQSVTDADVGMATPPQVPFDLELAKSLEGELVNGGTATWVIDIRNNGIVASPNPVTLTDVLPTGLTYAGFTGSGWSCSAAGSTVTCSLPQSLAVGASTQVKILTDVSLTAGTQVENAATVSAEGVEITLENNSDQAIGQVQAPPTTTTTTSTTTAPLEPVPSTIPPTSVVITGTTTTGGTLPATGDDSWRLAGIAMALVVGGSLLLVLRRRITS
ncbi:MAG: SdrD B-like domain-containing protein [Acidimicrobiales bacterium]